MNTNFRPDTGSGALVRGGDESLLMKKLELGGQREFIILYGSNQDLECDGVEKPIGSVRSVR